MIHRELCTVNDRLDAVVVFGRLGIRWVESVCDGAGLLGFPRSTLAQVLNQQAGGPRATAVCDRYSYDKEKRHALDTWGRHLDALIGPGLLGPVVPFPRQG